MSSKNLEARENENGIFTESTQERLTQLETEKKDIEAKIAQEKLQSVVLTKQQIRSYLDKMKKLDLLSEGNRQLIVDTFINSIYVYADKKKLAEEMISLVGLTGFSKALPKQLSGGMQQRASIARGLINKPKILLLDEPFGALDAFTRMNMQDEILRLKQKNETTMVMVTHDVDEAVYMSDYVVITIN